MRVPYKFLSRLCLLRVSAFLFIGGFQCSQAIAQQQLLERPSGLNTAQSIAGPATVNLGDRAAFIVPAGCKFVDASVARVLLANTTNPIPNNLAGILIPDSGQSFSVIQLADVGFLKNAGKERLNPSAILKGIRQEVSRQNQDNVRPSAPTAADVDWLLAPSYDADHNTLEYAIKAKGAGGASVNYVSSVLGRRAVLSLTTVFPLVPAPNLSFQKELAKGLSFKTGERYADHRPDDRLARSGLAELIVGASQAEGEPRYTLAELINVGIWVGAGLALLLGAWALTILTLRYRKARYYQVHGAAVLVAAGTNGHSKAAFADRQPLPPTNGKLSKNGHRRRKKLFSYHAFYSDMVMNLTRCNYQGSFGAYSPEDSTSYDSSASGNGHHRGAPRSEQSSILVAETSKLIDSQQRLIEGQRKLIEEQSKLIHEKSKLIDAENKMLEQHSELMSQQQLL